MNSKHHTHDIFPDPHHDPYSKTIFGFWVYLITDFVLFATFFATYAVLRQSTYGGPSGKELFAMDFALLQTLIILTCSFTMALAGVYAHRFNKNACISFLGLTLVLGFAFFAREIIDMTRLIVDGYSWKKSAFLSGYFTLIGTFALHLVFALLWIFVLALPILKEGITWDSVRRITCLRMFWQFLGIIWMFIFTIVYFMGR